MSKVISTPNAPAAIGPYSQAIVSGSLVFTSGQIAINPATQRVEATTIEAQTEQVMKNLKAILEEPVPPWPVSSRRPVFWRILKILPYSTVSTHSICPVSLPVPVYPSRTCPAKFW